MNREQQTRHNHLLAIMGEIEQAKHDARPDLFDRDPSYWIENIRYHLGQAAGLIENVLKTESTT